jgi:methyl-accepting chemotaxis protein
MASAASETSSNVNSVAAAVEEMNSTITEVSSNCTKAQELALQGNENSSSALDLINDLNQAAQEIGAVVDMITEITEQTKLLSLNATIEAARAGEAGKGFAVVASEVKELAKQTSNATVEIGKNIKGIQQKTEGVLSSINKVSSINNEVSEITTTIAAAIEEQSATTGEISRMVTDAAGGVEDVSGKVNELSNDIKEKVVPSIGEASAGVAKVLSNVKAMNDVATDTAASVVQIDGASGKLSELAAQSNTLVGKFKL